MTVVYYINITHPLYVHHIQPHYLPLFLHALRGLIRSTSAICLISIPTYLYNNNYTTQLSHLCDTVLSMQSINNSKKKARQAYEGYDGLLSLKKLPSLNSLAAHRPECKQFLFKVRMYIILLYGFE